MNINMFRISTPLYDNRLPKIALRAFILGFFAICVAFLRHNKRSKALNLDALGKESVPCVLRRTGTSSDGTSAKMEGYLLFPTVPGLPIPFKVVDFLSA